MLKGPPKSNTKNGSTTLEIRVPNPGCLAMRFPLDELNAYINHLNVESTKELEGPVIFKDILMHHKCGHVTSFSLDKR